MVLNAWAFPLGNKTHKQKNWVNVVEMVRGGNGQRMAEIAGAKNVLQRQNPHHQQLGLVLIVAQTVPHKPQTLLDPPASLLAEV